MAALAARGMRPACAGRATLLNFAVHFSGLRHATASPPARELARRDFDASIAQDPHGPLSGFAKEELGLLETPSRR